ncbi:hypothetical protein SAMN05216600_12814 [Pseudomonas cuatrocienegasensis]|uniref:DUF1653 domain-containing protein n=1 Tax=Pseudomonas cuatrocienegasensis TaxID=543360 RepID=A0ABY1BQV8_9PSED|nr:MULTISPECIES: hypothetical protein [Pseudomonas]OEC32865.1 hypothetical protein A7D25_21720 [Pseudomonas sp. 21C1]SER40857.1 hypothetical protein SAMN05216600_12814 [Pseudomonas cuatrocienegasensis]
MSSRHTYRPEEIRAGQTFFVSYIDFVRGPLPVPVVIEYLATSRRGYWPAECEVYPYRLRPELIKRLGADCTLYRTRRSAARALKPFLAFLQRPRSH